MAPWFELVLACNLKDDVPQQVVDVLNYLISPAFNEQMREFKPIPVPDHPFFQEPEWQGFLISDCYYFPGTTFSDLTRDEILKAHMFTVRMMIRRGADRIEEFLDWLAPYSQTNGFVGYTRCDESEEIDLIYFENGMVYYNAVELWKNPPTVSRRRVTKDGKLSSDAK